VRHAHKGDMKIHTKFWLEKPAGKRLFRRPRCRWEDNIRMDIWEKGWEGVDWIHLAQDRDQWQTLVKTVMDLLVPQKERNFLTS